ncbi:GMC family oxidoreductase [Saccharopolyspora terrae]|uniref:GMC family oxidoreductase n=1 Tax=Saccharopolyspora terrae TaxID=2530384 RepID=A0A4R4VKS5_9PSEU|nr:GMC oxidoreductase [Saccharopolyspora terrae]TDD06339.1 GMC family oxidoreductase [Saccharopolyspora terrae]
MNDTEVFDFVVVGSGAGGGPLASNLARAGHRVLLLEAGDDHRCVYYDVPVFHARASEDPGMRWDFFTRHFRDDAQQARDPKFTPERGGVLYPRGATLGGSTAISAMITVYPHNSDWDAIADLTGDESWRPERMRAYFERLERWRDPRGGERVGAARHGHEGWLGTTRAHPDVGGREPLFLQIIDAMERECRERLPARGDGLEPPYDPNDWRFVLDGSEGMVFVPVAVDNGQRNGSRERILATQNEFPGNLTIAYNSLATRVVFEGDRAVGVEYLSGSHLYAADPEARSGEREPQRHVARASREVVLCGGAFNTPQLLKLSGIGPRAELEAHGIEVLADVPGVGENLQDRYEVTVVNQLTENYPIFAGSHFDAPQEGTADPLFGEWDEQRDGPYTTNGTLAAYIKRSSVADDDPDLFVFSLPVFFRGYYPNYSAEFGRHQDMVSWVVLKAHTNNTAGRVHLRSSDPRESPEIEFNYFQEGNDDPADDLTAVVEGVEFARALSSRLSDVITREVLPGDSVTTREGLAEYVRDQAWGHHASCTCKIGADADPMAVLDSEFRVRGVRGLRVVDASAFPAIPGFFIATAVYMLAEKAADVILSEHTSLD